jgi:hypothetical protein
VGSSEQEEANVFVTGRWRRRLFVWAVATGLASVSVAVAGRVPGVPGVPVSSNQLPPVPTTIDVPPLPAGLSVTGSSTLPAGRTELGPLDLVEAAAADVRAPSGERLPAGTFLVGAARADLTPTPGPWDPTGKRRWQTEGCSRYGIDGVEQRPNGDHLVPSLADLRGWPAASPDCVYLGGFGLGPVRPAERVGYGGVWVRSLAVSNGERTFVYSIADAVGWFARYDAAVCSDCGIRDVRDRVSADLGVDVGDVIVGSTHSHATADTYGGWGGIPDWYRSQLRDAAIASAKQAVANLAPATITVGETHLRDLNNQRRDSYHSTVDTGATWLQATALDGGGVIATMAAFAGHPIVVDEPILHADWPGATARRFEAIYGGVGLLFEGGLGNASISRSDAETPESSAEAAGAAVADRVVDHVALAASALTSNDMAAEAVDISHPATSNPGLGLALIAGVLDREWIPGTTGAGLPGVYSWSKDDGPGQLRSCVSAGPTVITTAGAHRIGELVIAFAPGEIFSNIAEVLKEAVDHTRATMVLGQMNDALGYIIQSFEFDAHSNVVTHYGTMTGEYEEVFAIDRCFGDHVLQTLLDAAAAVGGS